MGLAFAFQTSKKLGRQAFDTRASGALIVEFGVGFGISITFFASLTKEAIYGPGAL